ncbi:hypothetical protein I2486_14085 [Cellulophaga sp. E16_2]|uniref:hypothetical protein n=1 Tax=Cellulophaga sp. E16_2 TaxID=2789297 RepID=UPI001A92C000|nr:hypothetical protein [Cellulophaga sp. E16_2]MBO0592532.1 hypothetical protein [Cellulophaga sp. E16_2]
MYFSVTDYYDPIGTKQIPSKCPGCGTSNCLELQFHQKRIETAFSKKITSNVSGKLFCDNTQSEIAPVVWTDEIEQYYLNEKSILKLQPKRLSFTKWFYILLILPLSIISVVIGYNVFGQNDYESESEAIEQVSVGDKIMVLYTTTDSANVIDNGNTWFLVKKIDADSIWVQRHKVFATEGDANFDLATSKFTEETLKASLKQFKTRGLFGHDYPAQKFSGYITTLIK